MAQLILESTLSRRTLFLFHSRTSRTTSSSSGRATRATTRSRSTSASSASPTPPSSPAAPSPCGGPCCARGSTTQSTGHSSGPSRARQTTTKRDSRNIAERKCRNKSVEFSHLPVVVTILLSAARPAGQGTFDVVVIVVIACSIHSFRRGRGK